MKWHPTKDIVALGIFLERRTSTVWVWGASKGLRKIGPVELANLVGFSKLPSNERKRAAAEGVKAWIDPEGYGRFIASKRCAFEDEVDLETGVKKVPQK